MSDTEFWVGDKVRILSSGKEGIFEGTASDGRARIKWNGKIILTAIKNIQVVQEPKRKKTISLQPSASTKRRKFRDFNTTIDLHIEVLNPSIAKEAPQIILNHQLLKCKEYIAEAIALNINSITIIHGKGSGQLKREVDHILTMFDAVRYSIPQNDGGATEIWLK